ncbi:nuclear factor 7, brain-like [Centropristis striata]|uniref:nuclear factor 7, brain-like n=1 Tax=Centropristis striata TaxID=184440 RepID=UPI0027DF01BD|nr:nuclear factor 7, brain-like [Centropristis striata]XP_059193126.1 nuclear factor 7, brain-like [Centropristis striata]XP_059193127.1 nuclear factor 7, brain-like [Centropristis striata]XP_059193128.1 nuclear factor 7, brain-like [Centropristis striata]XP_059193129.1 nuclear factor 7, brain-like [Centropristis striata]
MSEKITVVESFLSCHVCSETFRDPVSLSCNHSFCSSCLLKFWEQTENKNCPICKRKSSNIPPLNFALKELADSFAGRQKSGSSETEKEEKKLEVVCSKHPEETKLFCKDEDRAVCPVCEFSLHQSHKVVPIEQAVSDLKDQLKSDLQSLQDKRDKYKQGEKTYNEVIEHFKKQLLSTERQIRAEFNKLHQFLREEEESRLAALREEEEQKGKTISREMKRIQEQISSLSDSISAVEEELQKHNVPFLSSYKATQTRARVQCSLSDPQLLSGALIDVAKHLGNLSFRVWEKMKEKVHFSPVILDPNTANPWLYLSDDLTSVRNEDTKQQLPDNPERNTNCVNVLGSEGFSSGKHSWEVEVGDHPRWFVGLVKESADRKGKSSATPEYGIWCLRHGDGKYTNVVGQTVKVKKSPQRIRVQLNYDKRKVSFYDPKDMTHICTHRQTFTEKLFPYFSIGEAGDAKTADIKICPTDFSL